MNYALHMTQNIDRDTNKYNAKQKLLKQGEGTNTVLNSQPYRELTCETHRTYQEFIHITGRLNPGFFFQRTPKKHKTKKHYLHAKKPVTMHEKNILKKLFS